jgi:hypothetical protein
MEGHLDWWIREIADLRSTAPPVRNRWSAFCLLNKER